ncbi:MAG: 4Fe-4S dicluster domain-containing protein [Kiritimatiellia bacterium]
MSIKAVKENDLSTWVDSLISEMPVIGVQAHQGRFNFKKLKAAGDLRLDYDTTVIPPKAVFQPPEETLLKFTQDGYESVMSDEAFVLMGVHPYDVTAIRQMDAIFRRDNCDAHYIRRRANAVIVAVDPQNASEDVFAGQMGTSHVEEGYDILLTKTGDEYVVDAQTKKGEALAGKLKGREAGSEDLEARKQIWAENREKLSGHELKAAPSSWPGLLENGYDHPVWEEKAEKCFSCGSCNLVCPTCYCFDVQDDVNWDLKSGRRHRAWDGCMLTDFATVAGDHNFRGDRADRYRHRYYRKGSYVPDMIGGEIACVGCGRCIKACVAKIANPVEIFNRLQEGK